MSLNKFFSILTIAVGIVAFTTIGFAQDKTTTTTTPDKVEKPMKGEGRGMGHRKGGREGFGGMHGRRGGGMMRMLHGANLTDAQKTQIHSIMQANKPDQTTMEEVRTLAMAKRGGTITAEQQERLSALKTQAREKAKSVHQQVLAVLTPEQKAQIETRKQEMKQRMQERKLLRQQKPATTTEKPKAN